MNADGSLGVAVVGYAFMGKAHSNAWRNVGAFFPELPPVRQQLLVGRDPSQVKEAAGRYGWAESTTDWRAAIARDDIDIVDVCTPGHLHAEIALAALGAGKHVLVEKPLANTVADSEALVAAAVAARARGVQSMVGFNYRRVPALALARNLIRDGRIGTVRQLRLSYLQDWLADDAAPMTWRLRQESAGSGALGDLGSHAVDQLHYLVGEPVVTVNATLRTFVTDRPGENGTEPVTVDDACWATLRLGSGAVASLEVSRMATGRKNSLDIEVYGTTGSLSFSLENLNELHVDLDDGSGLRGSRRVLVTETEHPYVSAWWPPGHILGWDHTFTSQAADLLSAVSSGEPPRASFEDGLAVQRVLDAVSRSAADGGAAVAMDRPGPAS